MQPLERAVVTPQETVLAWYGPMGRNDMAGTGTQVGLKENISGENTILVTDHQIICLMIGPADTQNIDKGKLTSAVGTVIETVPTGDGVYVRKQQFESLWFNRWNEIISNIFAPGQLAHALETHRNYAIPFTSIQEVKLKQRFFNPGVHIKLKNGKTLKFAGFDKRQLDKVQSALTGKVTVRSSFII